LIQVIAIEYLGVVENPRPSSFLALLKSSGIKWKSKIKSPEFIDVVGEAEQDCLFALRGERTARCFGREFAFDCAEDRLGMYALPGSVSF
jgi:hypothetical protein